MPLGPKLAVNWLFQRNWMEVDGHRGRVEGSPNHQ